MKNVLKSTANFGKLFQEKRGFIALVYLTLAIQLSLTFGIYKIVSANKDWVAKLNKFFLVWIILALVTIIAFAFTAFSLPFAILFAFVFTVLQSFIILYLITKKNIPENVIRTAIFSVIAIFVLTTILGFTLAAMGINLSFMYFALMMVIIALIVIVLANAFFLKSKALHKVILGVTIVLFTIFIAVDTNTMLQRDYMLTFVHAAMNLYVDVVVLFKDILLYFTSE